MTEILTFQHISKMFPGVKALNDVQISLLAGEVHALLGENGAGKSTLIQTITGIQACDPGGEMMICGQQIKTNSPELSQRLGVEAIYQHPTLFNELSVMENLMIGRSGAIINWKKRREAAMECLARVDVNLPLDQPVESLRMAEKQLLEIARALSRKAKILILDEPTAALPKKDADHLLQLVMQLRDQGVGIIYISHRLEDVELIADRMTILRDGNYVGTYRTKDLTQQEIIRLMAGRSLESIYNKEAIALGEDVLTVEHLTCKAGGIEGLSFSVRAGEILGIAGLVGSGRTELARTLFGITPADSGSIRLNGEALTIRSPSAAIAAGIGYVPEDRHFHGVVEDLTVVDNIGIAVLDQFCENGFLNRKKEEAVAVDYVHRLGIKTPSVFSAVRNLSGGNQQKVALSRSMAIEPRLLILDEPTQGIDIGAKAEIYALMEALARQGVAIIMISSELPEVLAMSDRVVVMRQGKMVKCFDRADADQHSILEYAMERSATDEEG